MPTVIYNKETYFKHLNKTDREELASQICKWWGDFHNKRSKQIATAQKLQNYISLNQPDRNRKQGEEWKSNIKENKIYTTWDSMKAVMWKEIWSNEEQMFDVRGTSKDTEQMAERQKQAIVESLKKMNAGVQFDTACDYWGEYGEFVFKTDWKEETKEVTRFDSSAGYVKETLPMYANADIEAINPMFFNFDVTRYKYNDMNSWASCPKIFKRFATLEEIKANPLYTFTKEDELELETVDNTSVTEKEDDNNLATMTKYGDAYEVLYLQGDIKFNGVEYKNIVAEVFAGKYLIYFDKNPVFICPFVWDCVQFDKETGRGLSPLKSIMEMAQGKEELINTLADIAKLNANPPVWGSETFLKEKYKNGTVPYKPGRYLDFDDSYAKSMPTPVQFNGGGIGDIISIIANDISDASGINANVMGNIEQGRRTATEMQLARNGSDARVAMKLDKIYQINLRVVENVAELLAIFKNEPETLYINDKGQHVEVEITNAIRRAQYNYVYEDRNALDDRRQKFQEAFNLLNSAGQNDELVERIDWAEALKTGLEMTGFDNPDKFFKEQPEVDKVADFVKQLPEEFQQQIMQTIAPILQQAQMAMQAQGQQQEQEQGGI